MPRFTLKELLIATTLIAIGISGLLLPHHYGEAIIHAGVVVRTFSTILLLSAGPLIGAGLFTPLQCPWVGACMGFALQWLSFIAFLPTVH